MKRITLNLFLVFLCVTSAKAATHTALSAIYVNEQIKEPIRCGTIFHQYCLQNINNYPMETRNALLGYQKKSMAKITATANSHRYLSPSGRFPIYYYTNGDSAVPDSDAVTLTLSGTWLSASNGIPDYVEWVAQAADSSYEVIRNVLGYDDSNDSVMLHMINLDATYYALTYNNRYMEIDNNLSFFDKNKIDIKDRFSVTIAHELYHVIQFHYMGGELPLNFFCEPSAVWMEEKIYPHVNDYVQYVNSQMSLIRDPNQSLDVFSITNYDRVVWPMFLDEKYGHDVNRFVWEAYRDGKTDFKEVFEESIGKKGFSKNIDSTMANFGQWLFCTGSRSDIKPGFREASLWPTAPMETLNNDSTLLKQINLEPHGFLFVNRNSELKGLRFEPSYYSNPVGVTLLSPPTPPDSLNATSLLFPTSNSLITDTSSPYIIFSNGYSGQRSLSLYEKERFFIFNSGRSVNISVSPNINASLFFIKTVICTLEYENEEPYPPGRALYDVLQSAGINHSTDTSAKVWIQTHSTSEKFIDSSIIKLLFTSKTNKGVAYKIEAFGSSSRPIATSIRLPNDQCLLDYSTFQHLLEKDSAGSRAFAIAERWITSIVKSSVFPLPAKLSGREVFFTSDSAGVSSELFIYSLSGKLVNRIPASCDGCSYKVSVDGHNQRIFKWNLHNSDHAVVSPGIYLYKINDVSNNNSSTIEKGKLAIVAK